MYCVTYCTLIYCTVKYFLSAIISICIEVSKKSDERNERFLTLFNGSLEKTYILMSLYKPKLKDLMARYLKCLNKKLSFF